jgi:hypothetical protein
MMQANVRNGRAVAQIAQVHWGSRMPVRSSERPSERLETMEEAKEVQRRMLEAEARAQSPPRPLGRRSNSHRRYEGRLHDGISPAPPAPVAQIP